MARKDFRQSNILTTRALIDQVRESNRRGERFCFILGSGASIESGIPSGGVLEMRWMNCIMGVEEDCGTPRMDLKDMRDRAQKLMDDGLMEHSFEELEQVWKDAREKGWSTLPPEYYFDIYTLRFGPRFEHGHYYMEDLMEDKRPSIGYRILTRMLVENHYQNNLVITTNFDSLVEDALFLYGEKKPLSVDHEALADYFSLNIQRPIVVRVHRGLLLSPFNTMGETDHLSKEWEDVLSSAMRCYTPIVVGYGGGDGSLMSFLEKDPHVKTIYWCWRPASKDKRVPHRVKKLLNSRKNGFLVEIDGFDALMLELGREFFPDAVMPDETVKLLDERNEKWKINYREQYQSLKVNPETKKAAVALERAQENIRSVVDYLRRGSRKMDEHDYRGAIEEYNKAIELKKDYAAAYGQRGNAWKCLGEYQKAISDFDQAVFFDPGTVFFYNDRGNTWNALGEHQKAIEDYSRAIYLVPEDSYAYCQRGNAERELKEYEKAIADFTKAVKIKPDFTQAYNDRGVTYQEMENYQMAIDDFTKAIDLERDNKYSYQNRSEAYLALGETELARLDQEKADSLSDN